MSRNLQSCTHARTVDAQQSNAHNRQYAEKNSNSLGKLRARPLPSFRGREFPLTLPASLPETLAESSDNDLSMAH